MYTHPTAPLGIGQVLDGAFKLTAASLPRVWWYLVAGALLGSGAYIYQFSRMPFQEALVWRGDAVYWVLYFVGIFASLFFYAALVQRTHSIAIGDGERSPFGTALRRTPALLGGSILLGLAVGIGFILLIVPGVILMVSLALAFTLIVIDGAGPIGGLNQSHKLVWGHWWRTLALLAIAFVIGVLLYFLFGFVAALVAPPLAGGNAMLAGLISFAIIILAVQIVGGPFFTALVLSIYYDLKLRREGGDLLARAGSL